MFDDPRVRLVARALLAGLVFAIQDIANADDPFAPAVLKAALVAGVWAVVEYLTPLNKTVGPGL